MWHIVYSYLLFHNVTRGQVSGHGPTHRSHHRQSTALVWARATPRYVRVPLPRLNPPTQVADLTPTPEDEDMVIPVEGAGVAPQHKRVGHGVRLNSKAQAQGTLEAAAVLPWSQVGHRGTVGIWGVGAHVAPMVAGAQPRPSGGHGGYGGTTETALSLGTVKPVVAPSHHTTHRGGEACCVFRR